MGQLSQHKGSSSLHPARETKRRREPVPQGLLWLDTQLHAGGMGRRMEPRWAEAASLRLTGWDKGDVLLFCLNFSWHRNPHPAPTHDLGFEREFIFQRKNTVGDPGFWGRADLGPWSLAVGPLPWARCSSLAQCCQAQLGKHQGV